MIMANHAIDRRRLLLAGAACAAHLPGTETVLRACSAAETESLVRIDAHTHFYDPTRPGGVPWPGKEDKLLYRPTLPKHFREVAAPLGVTGTVVVEASPLLADNQWLLDLARDEPLIVGVVGHLRPGETDFALHLERFANNTLFRGIRVNHAELRKGIESGDFLNDLARLSDLDLALDLNGGPELPADVARLADKLPKLRIVINHAANLKIDGRQPPDAWLNGMRACAGSDNVWCKVSALVESASRDNQRAPREPAYYVPVLDALWKIFGEDRLLFGSNWPVSTRAGDYTTVIEIVDAYFGAHGPSAKSKFFAGNSQSAYKWNARQ
jgi:L-fuconolactonase